MRGDLRRPSDAAADKARAKALRGDLDAIVQTALKREPESRYQSATELADDLERYLDSKPVRAQADSAALPGAQVRRPQPAGGGRGRRRRAGAEHRSRGRAVAGPTGATAGGRSAIADPTGDRPQYVRAVPDPAGQSEHHPGLHGVRAPDAVRRSRSASSRVQGRAGAVAATAGRARRGLPESRASPSTRASSSIVPSSRRAPRCPRTTTGCCGRARAAPISAMAIPSGLPNSTRSSTGCAHGTPAANRPRSRSSRRCSPGS